MEKPIGLNHRRGHSPPVTTLGVICKRPPQRADSGHFLAAFRNSHGFPGDFLASPDRKIPHGFPDFFLAGNRGGLGSKCLTTTSIRLLYVL